MSVDLDVLRDDVLDLVEPWRPAGLRAVIVWGSYLDVLAGAAKFDPGRDIDVMVVCENSFRVAGAGRGLHGMPSLVASRGPIRYDCTLLDFGYVRSAVAAGRWTVVRAVLDGLVLKDDGAGDELRRLCPVIEPLQNSNWRDWQAQARKMLPKAAFLIERHQFGFAEVLIRNAFEMLAYSRIARREGQPPTPTTLPELAAKHAESDPVLADLLVLLRADRVTGPDVKGRWLHLASALEDQ